MLRRILLFVSGALVLAALAAGAWGVETKPIPPDLQLVGKESLAGIDSARVQVAVAWPTEKEFQAKTVPSPPNWPYALGKLLRPDVVPDKLRESLIMVKGFPVAMREGRIGRWQTGKYQIQVAELNPYAATVILVKDTRAKPNDGAEAGCRALFNQMMKDLFQEADEATRVPFVMARKFTRSAAFGLTPVRQAIPKGIEEHWYGRTEWWSDGQTIIMWIWRLPARPSQPQTMKVPVTVETAKPGEPKGSPEQPKAPPPAK